MAVGPEVQFITELLLALSGVVGEVGQSSSPMLFSKGLAGMS